jgi:folylpolyglutamate synthase/dihydropteroate synthase
VVIDPAAAVQRGLELAGPDDLVFVTGSLYVVGAARRELVVGVG